MSDILSGKDPEPAATIDAAPVVETVATEAPAQAQTGEPSPTAPHQPTDGRPRDDAGRFAPKAADPVAKQAAPPAAETEVAQQVPVTALMEVRRKWQDAERRIEELTRAQAAQPPKPAEPPKAPELFENPDAWRDHIEQQVEQRLTNERLNMSELMARQVHGSEVVDKAYQTFAEIARQNPAAYQQVMAQPHPWNAMVEFARKVEALNQIGDPLTFAERKEEELRQRLRAEWEAEQAAKAPPAPAAPPPSLPTPLGSVPSVAPRSAAPAWSGPTPLSDVFQQKRR